MLTNMFFLATIMALQAMEDMVKYAFIAGALVPALMVSVPAFITGVIMVNMPR